MSSYPKPVDVNPRHSVPKKSLYDLKKPKSRKGIAGWKLTKRPSHAMSSVFPASETALANLNVASSGGLRLASRQKYAATVQSGPCNNGEFNN